MGTVVKEHRPKQRRLKERDAFNLKSSLNDNEEGDMGVCKMDEKGLEEDVRPIPKSNSWECVRQEVEELKSHMDRLQLTVSFMASDIEGIGRQLSDAKRSMSVRKSNGIEAIVKEILRVIGSNRTKGCKGYQKAEACINDLGNDTFLYEGKTKVHVEEESGICRRERKVQTFPWFGKVSRKDSNMLAYLFRTSGIGEKE